MFRVKTSVISILLIAGLLLLAGCGANNKENASPNAGSSNGETPAAVDAGTSSQVKTIKHVWGETTIKGTPIKIVALDYAFIDMLSVLDIKPIATVGIGESGFPDYLKDQVNGEGITNVGQAKQPNLEVLKSVKPDLILANPDRHEMIKDQLSDIAPTIAFDDNNYEMVLANLGLLADVVGKKEQGDKVIQTIEAKIKEGKEKMKTAPSALVVGAFEDDSTVWLKSSFVGSLLSGIGVNYLFDGSKDNTAAESKTDIAKLSLERLGEYNPEYLFLYGEPEKWLNNPIYKNLQAVKENKAITVSRDLWSKGRGPRAAELIIDQALKTMAGGNNNIPRR
ncbi:Fe(3+)-citrate-binding protein YfmC [Paenibacillus baekrokdamisoli]|uniref:Fe(3+)-citrate-binding protein YfmC n=1 Tax=Paenibacillus baekrokdamisoli TaxID=1712516 RepID=A0A3G9IXJ5_9BACL|nr:iron-siderophore ABC transporter substrate-binding protein [Paenibacillus baekrokdamisoli]MBB3067900.1 iron complex transport system substrate-binding protein [Paenibacillus baekrokdamisoli]BBH23052.1 Fe(3+)-citrate-binding protein YfmC [Paenibacillus baekrokdamisoli]